MSTVNPTQPAALGLLALVPVAAYALSRGAAVVALSGVCVLLIAWSLYTAFGADEDGATDESSTPA